tara:strand:+ start:810 stop:1556 length:747 start_codon:yes stop_codon:yes gene_type:complete
MLEEYKKNYYSQNGEDGIILEIFKRLKLKKRDVQWCCEFGAWDGKHGSNTFNLIEKYKFRSVYIEGDKKKFYQLSKTKEIFPNILAINKYVDYKKKSKNSLDNILKKTKIPKNFEILSIDIDSNDLKVWKSLKNYSPKIVIIEINSQIKPGIYQEHSKTKQGNSFTSTVSFAEKKGYKLVCHTGNCIFIKKKYINKIKLEKKFLNKPELLFDQSWLNKKENFLKRFLKIVLPNSFISKLREIKIFLFN